MNDLDAMSRANYISTAGLGITSPNPIVGAVILSETGDFISEGFHQRGRDGQPGDHAEVVALARAGDKARGATIIVTLEPCNHHGKTPPCTEAIIAAGLKKVIFAVSDPNPEAQGGMERLRSAGITVESGVLEEEVSFTNRAWLTRMKTGNSYITVKIAATLDGFIAAEDGSSKWITSPAARHDVALLRSECDAIVTGTGTVLADDPELIVRGIEKSHTPERIIIGTRNIPSDFKIFNKKAPTHHLQSRDLTALREYCQSKRFNRVLVEAGPTLTSTLIAHRYVDEIVIYQAPTLLGRGRSMAPNLGITSLAKRLDFEVQELGYVGEGRDRNIKIHLNARSQNSEFTDVEAI